MLKGYLSLAYTWRNFGVEASGQAWYDYVTAQSKHPWGNERNDFSGDERLSDDGALARSRFSGVALDTLFVHGHHELGRKLPHATVAYARAAMACQDLNRREGAARTHRRDRRRRGYPAVR